MQAAEFVFDFSISIRTHFNRLVLPESGDCKDFSQAETKQFMRAHLWIVSDARIFILLGDLNNLDSISDLNLLSLAVLHKF